MLALVDTLRATGSSRRSSGLRSSHLLAATLLSFPLYVALTAARAEGKPSVPVPQKDAVGAAALPEAIAPVKAPFPMPQFQKPVFPPLSVEITEKGAKDGAKSTAAIQTAIDDVHERGGGTVIVPAGKWHTGRISLKSNVNLHLAAGAELHFSGEVEDYRPAVFTRNEGVEVMSLGRASTRTVSATSPSPARES